LQDRKQRGRQTIAERSSWKARESALRSPAVADAVGSFSEEVVLSLRRARLNAIHDHDTGTFRRLNVRHNEKGNLYAGMKVIVRIEGPATQIC
jgi:hypothetical protein